MADVVIGVEVATDYTEIRSQPDTSRWRALDEYILPDLLVKNSDFCVDDFWLGEV